MRLTPGGLGRRYAPFLVVAAVQVLLVAITPSKPADQGTPVASGAEDFGSFQSGDAASPGGGPTGDNPATGGSVPGGGDGPAGSAAGGSVVTGGGGTTTGGSGTATARAGGPAGAPGNAGPTGDMSRCDPKGRQIGPTYFMPTCKPVWAGGDNGGATMTGVTPTEIRFMYVRADANAQVDAILATQNLAASREDNCRAWDAFTKALNRRWELYGRKFVPIEGSGPNKGSGGECTFPHWQSTCNLTPPDPPCARAAARGVAALKPAFVMAPTMNNAFYNELAKLGIVVSGGGFTGGLPPAHYFTEAAPFYYEVSMDGTRAARMLAEYFCKRLAGKPVQHAGPSVTNPDLNPGTPPPKRRVGIGYPATNGDPMVKFSADLFLELISGGMCGSKADGHKGYPYQSDINTAQQQSTTTVAAMKADGITTVVCMCDPIAPVFTTAAMDQQNWEPEHLLSGTGLLDYDLLGRLYSPNQMRHAFGPSHLFLQRSFDQTDASKAWRDSGNPGEPGDKTANLSWGYFSLMGSSFQNAGPRPTARAIAQGLFTAPPRGGWAETGGDPHYPLIKYGEAPDDWTGISDAREVWWNAVRPSEVDGKPGSYQPVDGGIRYPLGKWPAGEPKVFQ